MSDADTPQGGEVIDFKPPGRRSPTPYTTAIASEIAQTYATTAKGLPTLCRENHHWPAYVTIFQWRLKHPEFADAMLLAKMMRGEALGDEILEIADDDSKDVFDGMPNPVAVRRSDTRIAARVTWLKLMIPERYNNRLTDAASHTPGYLPQDEAIKLLK